MLRAQTRQHRWEALVQGLPGAVYLRAMSDITQILTAIEHGEAQAPEELLALVYEDLRRLARHKLAQEAPDHTLQPTALVHEVWLRLAGADQAQRWDGRGHFFAAAAEAMRRILIEHARRKHAQKRGGGVQRVDFSGIEPAVGGTDHDLLALDEALQKLDQLDRRKADLVKLRFFAGLTIPEAAKAMGISDSTAVNDWAYARCWLRLELSGDGI